MTDQEKVRKGLEYCTHTDGTECPGCPYYEEEYCTEMLHKDTLELMELQETRLLYTALSGGVSEIYCKKCRAVVCRIEKDESMKAVKELYRFCPSCGMVVKWG